MRSEPTVAETRSNREDALIAAIPGHVTMQTKNMHDDVQEAVHRTCCATYSVQIVARPNRYGRATTCRLSVTFLP